MKYKVLIRFEKTKGSPKDLTLRLDHAASPQVGLSAWTCVSTPFSSVSSATRLVAVC
jgi:hypothetical protein